MRLFFCVSLILALSSAKPFLSHIEKTGVASLFIEELEGDLLQGVGDRGREEFYLLKSYYTLNTRQRRSKYLKWAQKHGLQKETMESFLERLEKWQHGDYQDLITVAEQLEKRVQKSFRIGDEGEQLKEQSRIILDSPLAETRVLFRLFLEEMVREMSQRNGRPARNVNLHVASQYPYRAAYRAVKQRRRKTNL